MSFGSLALFLVLVLTAAPAHADDASSKQEAAALAAESATHYKRGEFEKAAELLREAHARYPEPNLLYNLARALEGLGDRAGAVAAYRSFLAAAKRIDDRGAIERRIATLEAELAEQERRAEAAKPPPPPPVVERPIVAPPAPEPRDTPRPTRKLPWITMATGAAIVAAGAVMGYRARRSADRATEAMSGVEALEHHDDARRDALVANILFGVGGAVVITGIVIAW